MNFSQLAKTFCVFVFPLVILGCGQGPENLKRGVFLKAEFSSDGKTLYALRNDGLLVWWDYAAKSKLGEHQFGPPPSSLYTYNTFVLHPDGRRILTSHEDDSAFIWDLETKQQICELHPPDPNALGSHYAHQTFSPDGSLVALIRQINNETVVLVLDSEIGAEIWRMEEVWKMDRGSPSNVFIFPDNARILIGYNVYKIDLEKPLNSSRTAQPVHRFDSPGSVNVIHLSSDKKQVVIEITIPVPDQKRQNVFSSQSFLRKCDIDTYAVLSKYNLPSHHSPIQMTRDESLTLFHYFKAMEMPRKTYSYYMVMDGKMQRMKKPIRDYSLPVLLAPDDKNLVVGSENGFSIRDIETGKEIGLLLP